MADTSKQDTSAVDTSKNDSIPPDTQSIAIPTLRLPTLSPVSYSVYSLDGTLVSRSSVLDKSRLKAGVYYVVSKFATGERKMFRIVKD